MNVSDSLFEAIAYTNNSLNHLLEDQTMDNHQAPTMTIWGEVQRCTKQAEGILFVVTAAHGGYWLSPERNEEVPLELREETWGAQGMNGWYEEDCDAEIVREVFNLPILDF